MAVGFNGSTDQLSRATNLPTASTAFTACAWVRRDADTNNYGSLLWLASSTGAYSGIAFNSDGTTLSAFGSSGEGNIPAGGQPAQGQWVFVAVTQSGNTVTGWASPEGDSNFYSVNAASTNFTPTTFSAGNDGTGLFLNGAMQYIRVFNSVLNSAALALEKAATAAVATELFDWRCNDNTDTNDISGNARNPTVGGTLTTQTGPSIGGVGGGSQAPRTSAFLRMLMNN